MKQNLRIGVFGARGIPSTYSGYETFLTVLLPELAERGHSVTMYCRKNEGDFSPGSYRGVDRVILPSIRSKQLSTLSHGFLASLASRLSRHDVVLAVNVANAAFTLLARATGQRVVLNTDGQEWLRGKWGVAAKTYFRFSAHIAGLGSSALISDSDGMKTIYRNEFGSDSTVIPYCWSKITGDDPHALESIGVRRQGYLLVAGRLNPENNIDRVVDAYIASGVSMPLVVLGAANYGSPVARRLSMIAGSNTGVRLGGHVADRAAYATLVREAAAYIHGHSVGGINPSLLEAMGCGARIVALSTTFNREALGNAGLYYSGFGTELENLLKSLETADAMAAAGYRQRARERALQLFDLSSVTDAYEALLREVATARPWCRTTLPTKWTSPDAHDAPATTRQQS